MGRAKAVAQKDYYQKWAELAVSHERAEQFKEAVTYWEKAQIYANKANQNWVEKRIEFCDWQVRKTKLPTYKETQQ